MWACICDDISADMCADFEYTGTNVSVYRRVGLCANKCVIMCIGMYVFFV